MIEIENINSLEHAFHQGINLFVGAGFSFRVFASRSISIVFMLNDRKVTIWIL